MSRRRPRSLPRGSCRNWRSNAGPACSGSRIRRTRWQRCRRRRARRESLQRRFRRRGRTVLPPCFRSRTPSRASSFDRPPRPLRWSNDDTSVCRQSQFGATRCSQWTMRSIARPKELFRAVRDAEGVPPPRRDGLGRRHGIHAVLPATGGARARAAGARHADARGDAQIHRRRRRRGERDLRLRRGDDRYRVVGREARRPRASTCRSTGTR